MEEPLHHFTFLVKRRTLQDVRKYRSVQQDLQEHYGTLLSQRQLGGRHRCCVSLHCGVLGP